MKAPKRPVPPETGTPPEVVSAKSLPFQHSTQQVSNVGSPDRETSNEDMGHGMNYMPIPSAASSELPFPGSLVEELKRPVLPECRPSSEYVSAHTDLFQGPIEQASQIELPRRQARAQGSVVG